MLPLKIYIVSDVSCPWCIIGYQALQQALGNLADEVSVELHWHPFELNPHMPPEGQDIKEHIQQKYGTTAEQSDAARQMIAARGAEVGFEFAYDEDKRIYNTFDAHRLLHWAGELGQSRGDNSQTDLKLALFKMYFQQGGNPSNHDDLCKAVEAAGLDANEARQILNSDRYQQDVRKEQERFLDMGIAAVPAFIFNNKQFISGGQPPEIFEETIRKILSDAKTKADAQ